MNRELGESLAEMYRQFCRLKGYKLPNSPIEVMVDKATGIEEAHMKEFARFFRTEVLGRLP